MILEAPQEYKGQVLGKVIKAIGECENGDPKKNKYGLMCWTPERGLCRMNDKDAQKEVEKRLNRYVEANGDMSLMRAIRIYSPPGENDTERHAQCISEKSGVELSTKLSTILSK